LVIRAKIVSDPVGISGGVEAGENPNPTKRVSAKQEWLAEP
jgi:hypothetical protein